MFYHIPDFLQVIYLNYSYNGDINALDNAIERLKDSNEKVIASLQSLKAIMVMRRPVNLNIFCIRVLIPRFAPCWITQRPARMASQYLPVSAVRKPDRRGRLALLLWLNWNRARREKLPISRPKIRRRCRRWWVWGCCRVTSWNWSRLFPHMFSESVIPNLPLIRTWLWIFISGKRTDFCNC